MAVGAGVLPLALLNQMDWVELGVVVMPRQAVVHQQHQERLTQVVAAAAVVPPLILVHQEAQESSLSDTLTFIN